MAAPLALFGAWIATLGEYIDALQVYTGVVDDIARKSRPAARDIYLRAIKDAREIVAVAEAVATDDADGVSLAKHVFAKLDQLDRALAHLNAGADAALDPSLLEEATRKMSRTFFENVDKKAKQLRGAREQVNAAARAAAAELGEEVARRIAGAGVDAIAAAYESSPKSAAGADLYASVLHIWRDRGEDVSALVEAAKDEALGIVNPSSVPEAIAARSGMHPLQAMGLTFGLKPDDSAGGESVDASGAAVIDATLPQAKTTVRYDIAPLVDVRAAAKFGPVATKVTGLNYNLIQRLRTIREDSIPPGAREPPAITIPADYTRALRTIDGGHTFQPLVGNISTVGAGPKPRVERQGELLESALFDEATPVAKTIADYDTLAANYRNAELDPLLTAAELARRLVSKFEQSYDDNPPKSSSEFLAAVLGERDSRDIYRTYIARALVEATGLSLEKRLARREAAGTASLFGPGFQSAARQEAMLTSMSELRGAILAARAKIVRSYDRTKADGAAQRIFARGEVNDVAAARLRMEAMALYQRVIDDAFVESPGRVSRVVEKTGSVEPRPSLKLYAIEKGDTSRPE